MTLQKQLIKIFSSVAFWHIMFWFLNLLIFSSSAISDYLKDGKVTIVKLLPGLIYAVYLVFIVYLNYLVFIPRFAAKRKVFQYVIWVVLSTVVASILFTATFNWILKSDIRIETSIAFGVLGLIYIIITSFFKFFKDWVVNQGLRVKILEIEKQKVEAELDTLKSQLNPHFLFNVLNNIYSHSLLKSDITPSIVIKLSDLMSYILYDCKSKLVPIQKEFDFIQNYIELEKIRVEKDINVKFEHENSVGVFVPPLLFFPLIENSFKHGIGSNPDKREVFLKFELQDNNLLFEIINTKGNSKGVYKNKKKGGIGIENVRKRLTLLYPGTHKMEVLEKEDTFEIRVRIENINLTNNHED